MNQNRNEIQAPAKPTYLSLFSGCGGFDEGFDQVGYESKGAFDFDSNVVEVYKNNLAGPIYKHLEFNFEVQFT